MVPGAGVADGTVPPAKGEAVVWVVLAVDDVFADADVVLAVAFGFKLLNKSYLINNNQF